MSYVQLNSNFSNSRLILQFFYFALKNWSTQLSAWHKVSAHSTGTGKINATWDLWLSSCSYEIALCHYTVTKFQWKTCVSFSKWFHPRTKVQLWCLHSPLLRCYTGEGTENKAQSTALSRSMAWQEVFPGACPAHCHQASSLLFLGLSQDTRPNLFGQVSWPCFYLVLGHWKSRVLALSYLQEYIANVKC